MSAAAAPHPAVFRAPSPSVTPYDPQWYRRAVIYQLNVRSFCDSNGDGIGDLRGVIQKLDYLQGLGVDTLWLLPFYPSPLRDGGYDVTELRGVHPQQGTLRDFRKLVAELQGRQMHLMIEMVLNHTSDEHPWFQRARLAPPHSSLRDFYVWSDNPKAFPEARVIFHDTQASNWSWDPVAKAYYFHRFYSYQPDLNYDHPEVRKAIFQAVDHWLELGVDGLGLTTLEYLFEREGTNCENLPENHSFLAALRRHVEARFGPRLLVAQVNQWPEDSVAYFGQGDECQAALHFPLMTGLYMAVEGEDCRPIVDVFEQTPSGPPGAQWFLFLRNQDELTLQMMTEQQRGKLLRQLAPDPQFRVHSGIRRRLAPLMENNRAKIELLQGLLFSLPGTPVTYYGDELGMGDNPYLGDRDGVRTPMQWSPDRNAGFSQANSQRLVLPVITDPAFHYETVNVQTQSQSPHSLLSWFKRLVACRKESPALTEGGLEFVDAGSRKVLAFVRSNLRQRVLVVANLSRFVQVAQLDLAAWSGHTPVELLGGSRLPRIGSERYWLTLAPYAFYWLALDGGAPESLLELDLGYSLRSGSPPAVLEFDGPPSGVFEGPAREILEQLLAGFLHTRRWFGAKARTVRSTSILDVVPLPYGESKGEAFWTIVEVQYAESPPDCYLLPLALSNPDRLRWEETPLADAVVALIRRPGPEPDEQALHDAFGDPAFHEALLWAIGQRKIFAGQTGRMKASPTRAFARLRGNPEHPLTGRALKAESSNSVIVYGDRLLLKLVRRLDEGTNPDLEIGRFLTEVVAFPHAPAVAGALEYLPADNRPMTAGILSAVVPNEGNAWDYALGLLDDFFTGLASGGDFPPPPEIARPAGRLGTKVPGADEPHLAPWLPWADLLGHRTAEMHLALATRTGDLAFDPEPFSRLYQRSLYQDLRNQAQAALELLEGHRDHLASDARRLAEEILDRRAALLDRLAALLDERLVAARIRCHGDYHLGQVLFTGNDFVIIDFEGEPARPISERQFKASPLRDVAGMLRSFDYAAHASAREHRDLDGLDETARRHQDGWLRLWVAASSSAFLDRYLEIAAGAVFLPADGEQTQVLLDAYLLEKALYELQYELNNRPDWAMIPLAGLLSLSKAEVP